LVERRANRIAPFRLGNLYTDAECGSGFFDLTPIAVRCMRASAC